MREGERGPGWCGDFAATGRCPQPQPRADPSPRPGSAPHGRALTPGSLTCQMLTANHCGPGHQDHGVPGPSSLQPCGSPAGLTATPTFLPFYAKHHNPKLSVKSPTTAQVPSSLLPLLGILLRVSAGALVLAALGQAFCLKWRPCFLPRPLSLIGRRLSLSLSFSSSPSSSSSCSSSSSSSSSGAEVTAVCCQQ